MKFNIGDYVWLSPNVWIDKEEVIALGHPYKVVSFDKFNCAKLDPLRRKMPEHPGFRQHKTCHIDYLEADPFRTAVWLEKHGKRKQD